LLHTEVMREHLLVEQEGDGWRVGRHLPDVRRTRAAPGPT
jgi:hypothetical protein